MAVLKLAEADAAARADSFFGALPSDARAALIAKATLQDVARGTVVCREGDPGERALIVVAGVFRVSAISRAGKDIVLAYAAAGDVIGEISVLGGGPRTATATAIEPARLLVIHRGDLKDLCAREPDVAWTLLGHLARRIRRTNELLETGRGAAMGPKLACGILKLMDEHGVAEAGGERMAFKISQSDLGAFVSLSRENVNRQLKEWEADGFLALDGGRVVVLDRDALEEIAEFGE